jgi:hypothetical protein
VPGPMVVDAPKGGKRYSARTCEPVQLRQGSKQSPAPWLCCAQAPLGVTAQSLVRWMYAVILGRGALKHMA